MSLWSDTPAAKPKEQSDTLIPKGKYQAVITNALLDSSGDKDVIRYEYTISQGPFQGRKIFKNWYLTSKTIPYIKAEFNKILGSAPKTEDEIAVVLSDLFLNEVEIFVSINVGKDGYKDRNEATMNKIISTGANKKLTVEKVSANDVPF